MGAIIRPQKGPKPSSVATGTDARLAKLSSRERSSERRGGAKTRTRKTGGRAVVGTPTGETSATKAAWHRKKVWNTEDALDGLGRVCRYARPVARSHKSLKV